MVIIFADHEPHWNCHAGSLGFDCNAAATSICELKPCSWEWVGGTTVSDWGLICGDKFKVGGGDADVRDNGGAFGEVWKETVDGGDDVVQRVLLFDGEFNEKLWGVEDFENELFPTVVRNTELGFTTQTAQMEAMLAPFVVVLGGWLPFAVFAACGIMGGVFAFLLPETSNQPLYDTFSGLESGFA
ncbi:hypothetical protein JHK82_037552 [Glycine max]|nr:hypothetical protein JHK82_037552 [Glycine max]KAG5131565.1 hypothetical protein JHK84_037962 [Glycine max]